MCFDIRIVITYAFLILEVNRIKLFVSNNITIKTRFQKFSNSICLDIFEMNTLYTMWFYALQFVSCKASVDAFSLFFNLFFVKFCRFVSGAYFDESHWLFISICSCFIHDYYLSVFKRARLSG